MFTKLSIVLLLLIIYVLIQIFFVNSSIAVRFSKVFFTKWTLILPRCYSNMGKKHVTSIASCIMLTATHVSVLCITARSVREEGIL